MCVIRSIIAAVVLIGFAEAGAAVVMFDDFNGPADTAPDPVLWNAHADTKLSGNGTVQVFGGTPVSMTSDGSFLYEPLKIAVANHALGNTMLGYDGADAGLYDWIYLRADTGNIEVGVDNVTVLTEPWAMPTGAFTATIEWSASQLRVVVDGVEELLVTNPAQIPNNAMNVLLHRYPVGGVTFDELDYVQVGIPEPGVLGLGAVGAALVLSRHRRR